MFCCIIHKYYMFINYKLSSATCVPSCHALKNFYEVVSNIVAIPIPKPMHCVESAYFLFSLLKS